MHCILWSLKRADQCSRALQRRLLDPHGITPARYDMLFIILRRTKVNTNLDRIFQSRLRKLLGVTAPTVCKMAKALERLGLITRKRERFGDRRQVSIEITRSGIQLLRRIRKRVIRPGILWLALYTALSKSRRRMGSLEYFTQRFREGCRDPALFPFPDQREQTIGRTVCGNQTERA